MASSKGSPIASLLVLSFAAVAAVSLGVVSAQNSVPSCASKLVPCASSLNTTSRPATDCCNAIKEAVSTESERSCLCSLLKSPEILKTFNINVTQALELPKRCGTTADLSACNQAPAPTAGGPPGTSGGNGASGLSTIGMSGVAGLFLLWASMM